MRSTFSEANVYGVDSRNVTPYGQVVDKNHLPEIFAKLAESSDYHRRRAEIDEFNATSRLGGARTGTHGD